VETYAAECVVVSWWELASVAALFAVFVIATESAPRGDCNAGVWAWEGASFELIL
jgi:hypothetical protein